MKLNREIIREKIKDNTKLKFFVRNNVLFIVIKLLIDDLKMCYPFSVKTDLNKYSIRLKFESILCNILEW